MKVLAKSVAETNKVAVVFLAKIKPKENGAVIFGLSGDLGAGKTTFIQAVAKICGVSESVSSPTFVIQKNYPIKWNGFEKLVHVDAYRLEKGEEILRLKWKETISDPKSIIFIEWPEKIKDILPEDVEIIYFKFIDENTREIVTS